MSNVQPFAFETEFTSSGDVVGGPQRKFVSREEADRLAASARSEGETKAKQTIEAKGFASVDKIVAHLSPVSTQLAQLAEQLRREAAELALVAARKIAGQALDKAGDQVAADAIAQVVRQLKANPVVTVTLAPESIPEVQRHLGQRGAPSGQLSFVADPKSKPGDWRVEWTDGSVAFNRDAVEAAIEQLLNDRLQDPVEPQLELFSAA